MANTKANTTTPRTKTKHDEWCEDIRGADGAQGGIKLSEFEQEFMDSIEERLESGRTLTPRQAEILEEIWDRI